MRTCVLFSLAAVASLACHASSLDSGVGGVDAGAPSDAAAGPDGRGESDARFSDAAEIADANDAGAPPGDTGPAPCVVTSYPDGGAGLVGADAGSVPAFNPACCPSPEPGPDAGMFAFGHPRSFSVTPGVSPAPDGGTMLVGVPDGYTVTLDPSLPAIPAGASLSNATFSIVDLAHGVAYPSYSTLPFDNPTGPGFSPLIPVLPAGVMAITYALSGAFALDASSSSTFTSSGFQLFTACGAATVDVVLPDVPPLTLVHVTIDHASHAGHGSGFVDQFAH